MPSSQANADIGHDLEAVADIYEQARELFASGDLQGVADCMDRAETLLGTPEAKVAPESVLRRVQKAHSDLCTLISAARDSAREQLQRTNKGKKALTGYSGRSHSVGSRHISKM